MSLFNVYPLNPIAITKAAGSRVWDDKGQEYLDMYGGHAVISIGHTQPHWVKRIEDQLHAIAFYSNSVVMPIQEELATALNEISGKKDFQLFLCNSGAEANENALKLASFHTGRKKVVSFTKAFHGRTSLAVAATDNPSIIAPVNETDNIIFLPFNDIAALQKCFAEQGTSIAAVIIEGIQGVAGIYVADDAFLQAIFAEPAESTLTIDLEKQTITIDTTGASESFEINAYKKTCMLNGYDDIDYLLSMKEEIEQFELNLNK
jgi:acetylornithine/N-succinyldiaminopimelate aminotransferase